MLFTSIKILFWAFQYVYSKILGFVYGGPSKGTPTLKSSILTESATSLANRIRNKKVTSTEVVEAYIYRIKEINGKLNCVVDERFEEALEEARRVDELIRSGVKSQWDMEKETPFLGVPFTTDDSSTVKGLPRTRGTWRRKDVRTHEDEDAVSLMREAGAIPLACTNVSDSLCCTCETINPVFGRTCNPYAANRSAGGSSGGGACLVASAGSPLGIASDWAGSLRIPCAFNGIFGHKPSTDRLLPTVEFSKIFSDSVGPMSRSSADLLPALKVLTKNSGTDLKLSDPVDVKRLRYYFMDDDGGCPLTSYVDKEIKEAIHRAVNHFRNNHDARVERVDLKRMKEAFFMCKAKLCEHTTERPTKECNLNIRRKIVKAVFRDSHHTLAYLLTRLLEKKFESRNGSRSKEFNEGCAQLFHEFQELLAEDGVFIYPTQPTAAIYQNESLTKGFNVGYAAIFNALGLPATHCPTGLNSEGLPVGFQVVGGMYQDRLTIAVAREIEEAFGGWRPPPTTGTFTLKNAAFHNIANEKVNVL